MRIHRLTTGRVRGPRRRRGALRYLIRDWSDETLPINAFLVEHPEGLCLVDAGQSAAAATPGYLPRWHPFLRIARFELGCEDEVGAQIERLGFAPDDVRWVVLTHLHTDHVGGLAAFPGAEVFVSETEWARAQGLGGIVRGYVRKQIPPPTLPCCVRFDGAGCGPFAGSVDLVADGSLRLVPLPGHTAGHIGLLVTAGRERALFAGDVAHNSAELESVAPELARYCRTGAIRFLAAHDDRIPSVIDFGVSDRTGGGAANAMVGGRR